MDFPAIDESRARLLEAIDPTRRVTVFRGPGNRGDELIVAGLRRLLEACVYEELDADTAAAAGVDGDTALIIGSGGWCRTYHRTMPALLGIVEQRFDRVIVLPSSFEPEEDAVRAVLDGTGAIVFAREPESHARIADLCDARMAHDTAFFFDYSPWAARDADGTLDAFRTDHETGGRVALPPGNDDVSATAADLDAWLDAIARHDRVRTDRAHVMIAAALMGRAVEWAPGSYHKLEALTATLPAEARLTRIAALPRRAVPPPPAAPGRERLVAAANAAPAPVAADGEPRVCAVILSRDRPALLPAAVESALVSGPGVEVLVVDNNSGPATQAVLDDLGDLERVTVQRNDTNVGCGVGRQRAAERVDAELLLFLDDDAELMPNALERLVASLEAHPGAVGVTPLVATPDGAVSHCGGTIELSADVARFTIDGSGLALDDPAVPADGPSDWMTGCGLVRRSALLDVPIDPAMTAYYEDNDWSLRVRAAAPDREPFRRCRDAIVLHHAAGSGGGPESDLDFRDGLTRRIAAHARFFEAHGVLLHSGGEEIRGVLAPDADAADPAQARLLLRLVSALGREWLLEAWMGGDLGAVIAQAHELERRARAAEAEVAAFAEQRDWLARRHATLEAVERGGWWRLRGRLLPVLDAAGRVRDRVRP